MYTVLIALIVIAAVLLVLIVLVQNSKGGGLAPNLNAGTQFGGVAEQKSKLEKYTDCRFHNSKDRRCPQRLEIQAGYRSKRHRCFPE